MLEPLYEAHADDEPFEGSVSDELTARSLLIEHARNERKRSKLAETLAAVQAEYVARLDAIAQRQDAIREMLTRFVADHGKVSFPDVGGCSLAQRKAQPKITDPEALAVWALERQPDLVETTYRVPATSLKAFVTDTGELPPGVEMVTPEPGLTIRGAS